MDDTTAAKQHLRIVVADDNADLRFIYSKLLPLLGHEVIGAAGNGQELIDMCAQLQPDLIIADITMPVMDGIRAAERVFNSRPLPIVLISGHHDRGLLERVCLDHVMDYVEKPLTDDKLQLGITLALLRFEQFKVLQHENPRPRQALHDRKLVERAKRMVMEASRIGEADAFARLQKTAHERGQKIVDVAKSLVGVGLTGTN